MNDPILKRRSVFASPFTDTTGPGTVELSSPLADLDSHGAEQKQAYEKSYSPTALERFAEHDTPEPLMRYLRDRRLGIGLAHLQRLTKRSPADWDVLIVCGGAGGEGTYLAHRGFRSVTVSDFSVNALKICNIRDPKLRTCVLNAEQLTVPDGAFSVVVVQDGLHELRRPTLGLTEMLRVAREAVIVIEPHTGLIARLFGTRWEYHDDVVNYVFRWNQLLFEQVCRSYLLSSGAYVKAFRFWHHNVVMYKLRRLFGTGRTGLTIVKGIYLVLDTLLAPLGNMMVGIVIKNGPQHLDVS
jgi:ubiquinone/menaquinone biosynthesis C-methylase UbiE